MSKRNPGLPRNPRDSYPTPEKAVEPLVRWLQEDGDNFVEPCCGEGKLIQHLGKHGFHCTRSNDITGGRDALSWSADEVGEASIVTNPPWDREILHPMIRHFVSLRRPVWLLLDADWMHTKQAAPYVGLYCTHIVSIGRVRWMEGTTMDGYDNSAWYRFQIGKGPYYPVFVPRETNEKAPVSDVPELSRAG